MNTQIQALAILPKLSEQQLIQALQGGSGALPIYAVMAELEARKKRSAGFAGNGGPPRTSVKDDMVQQASGIQSLRPQPPVQQAPMAQPQPMRSPVGMAEGGMVEGYAAGDLIPYGASGWDRSLSDEEKARIQAVLAARERQPGSFASMMRAPSAVPSVPAFANVASGVSTESQAATPPPLRAASAQGIRTVGGSNGTSGGAAPAGYVPREIAFGSFEDALKGIPQGTAIPEAQAALKASDMTAKDKQNAKWEALMRMGLGMATTPGSFGTALARGAGQGLDSLAYNQRQIKEEEKSRRNEQALLAMKEDERQMQRYGIGRANLKDQANLAHQNEQGRFNAAQLASQDKWHADQNATTLKAAGIRAAASGASGNSDDALEFKYVKEAALLRKNVVDNVSKDLKFQLMKPEAKSAFMQQKLREAFAMYPHLAARANIDVQATGAPGLTAAPTGKVLSLN